MTLLHQFLICEDLEQILSQHLPEHSEQLVYSVAATEVLTDTRDDCIFCNGTGEMYYSEGEYGHCIGCGGCTIEEPLFISAAFDQSKIKKIKKQLDLMAQLTSSDYTYEIVSMPYYQFLEQVEHTLNYLADQMSDI